MFDYPDADSITDFVARIPTGHEGTAADVVATIARITDRAECADVLHRELMRLPVFDVYRHRALICVLGELGQTESLPILERFAWLAPDKVLPSRSVLWIGFAATDWMLQARAAQMIAWIAGTGWRDTQLQIVRGHPSDAVRYAAIGAWLLARTDDPDAVDELRAVVPARDRWAVSNAGLISELSPRHFAQLVNAKAVLTA